MVRHPLCLTLVAAMLSACGPGSAGEPADEPAEPESPSDDPLATLCAPVTAELCGPSPCIEQARVDLTDPERRTHLRPTLVIDTSCRPHALLLADEAGPGGAVPAYMTTQDGRAWSREVPPMAAWTGSLVLDPSDQAPIVIAHADDRFTALARRDGSWGPAGIEGDGTVMGAATTREGRIHVLAIDDREVVLHGFAGLTPPDATVLGPTYLDLTLLATDPGREQLQMIYRDTVNFQDEGLGWRWWGSGVGFEGLGDDIQNLTAIAAAGDPARPQAYALVSLVLNDLWLFKRDDAGVWSRHWITASGHNDNLPKDAEDGQLFIRHIREVHGLAVVVDRTGAPRWIWSEIERFEPMVAHQRDDGGITWSGNTTDTTGSATLWIGWPDGDGVASRPIADDLGVRFAAAAVDATGVLHLLALAGPLTPDLFDYTPIYLRLGV